MCVDIILLNDFMRVFEDISNDTTHTFGTSAPLKISFSCIRVATMILKSLICWCSYLRLCAILYSIGKVYKS